VKQTTQIVVQQPPAPTQLVASLVPVWLDTAEMDLRVKVSHIKILTSCYLSYCNLQRHTMKYCSCLLRRGTVGQCGWCL